MLNFKEDLKVNLLTIQRPQVSEVILIHYTGDLQWRKHALCCC